MRHRYIFMLIYDNIYNIRFAGPSTDLNNKRTFSLDQNAE